MLRWNTRMSANECNFSGLEEMAGQQQQQQQNAPSTSGVKQEEETTARQSPAINPVTNSPASANLPLPQPTENPLERASPAVSHHSPARASPALNSSARASPVTVSSPVAAAARASPAAVRASPAAEASPAPPATSSPISVSSPKTSDTKCEDMSESPRPPQSARWLYDNSSQCLITNYLVI